MKELGYYAKLFRLALTTDVRVFQEAITNGIANNRSGPPAVPEVYKNTESSTIEGWEYQVNFQPSADTRVFWSQTWTRIDADASVDTFRKYRTEAGAAPCAASLAIFHTPAPGWDLSLGHHLSDGISLLSANAGLRYTLQRMDVRVARKFRIGSNRSELAFTVQNLGPEAQDGGRKFYFDQRTMLALRAAR